MQLLILMICAIFTNINP